LGRARRLKQNLSTCNSAYSRAEFLSATILEEVACRACTQAFNHQFWRVIGRQQDDADCRVGFADHFRILGQPLFGIVPIFAFVFLVSLGEDFNILTIARIREEVQQLGHHRGIAAAIALTDGVVSSCGLVMAASFTRLAGNAVVEVAELGFTVVVGILLDTFVVRPLLVPAIATMLGRWNWVWPLKNPLQNVSIEGTGGPTTSSSGSKQDTQSAETAS